MLCSRCKSKAANVHFTGVVNGKEVSAHMCDECAKSSGISIPSLESALGSFVLPSAQFPGASPVFTELLNLLSHWSLKPAAHMPSRGACPRCRWTLSHFQKTGRMGCPECYVHFQNEARPLLKKIHGHPTHKGKKPATDHPRAKPKERKESLADLRAQLDKAVKEEKYELAAEIRDKIRAQESSSK